MRISHEHSPQFDPDDGTVGDIQCVRRWAVTKDGQMHCRQGRCTKATREEAEASLAMLRQCNSKKVADDVVDGVTEFWCWPTHFDPVAPVLDEKHVIRTAGTTPEQVIKNAVTTQCPGGYPMKIVDPDEWTVVAECVNQGIDSHLEALTLRSIFDNGQCLVHPEELHVLLRRLWEWYDNEEKDSEIAFDLRSSILVTLDIEEV